MVRIDIRLGNQGQPVQGPNMTLNAQQNTNAINTIGLTSEMILKYLLGTDEKIETIILCCPENTELVTTDLNLYEAVGSIKAYDNVQLNKLTKLVEVTHVFSHKQQTGSDKPILKEERVEQLRKSALNSNAKTTTQSVKKQNNKMEDK